MEHLPLLVAHGTAVWIAALCAAVLAAVTLDWLRRRRATRRGADARRGAMGEPLARLEGAEGTLVTLQGRIVASGVPAARFEDGAEVAAASAGSHRAEALAGLRAQRLELVTDRGAVRLDGPVDVIVGEIETHTGWPPHMLDAALRRRIEGAGGLWDSAEPVVFRSVRSGTQVWVRGELRRADVGDGLLGYRDRAGALRLAPPAGQLGAGLHLACQRAPRRLEARMRAPLVAAGAGVVMFAGVFVGAPELHGRRPIHGEALAEALAATPLHRDRALAAYAGIVDAALSRAPLDADRLETLYAMELHQGRCDRAVQVLLDHGQWARAEAGAERCGLPLLAARAAYERGAFGRAASTWDGASAGVRDGAELTFALRVHLLDGDLPGALRAARRVADGLRDAGLPELDCIVQTLEAGEAAPPPCVAPLVDWTRSGRSYWTASLLAIEAGESRRIPAGFLRADPLFGPGAEAPQWALVRGALDQLLEPGAHQDEDFVTRAHLAAVMAGFESACGEHDEALRWAAVAAASIAGRTGIYLPNEAPLRRGEDPHHETLPGMLLLRAGRFEAARAALVPFGHMGMAPLGAALADAAGSEPGEVSRLTIEQASTFFPETTPAGSETQIPWAALYDDPQALSELLQRGAVTARVLRVAGLTAHDARGREALSAWLRRGKVEPCHGCDVGARFADVSARLAVAEEIGDAEMTVELHRIAGAFRRALLRRATALPLLMLEQIPRKWVPPVELALGDRHTCVRSADTTVRCWGSNDHGQLGDGAGGHRLRPAVIPGLADVAQIAAGGDETCARMRDGTVLCWGGTLGTGTPTPVPGVAHAARIAVGHGAACAVGEDTSLTCWGPRNKLALGRDQGPLFDVRDVALGVEHGCILRTDGSVWCWGESSDGQLGDGQVGSRGAPAPVPHVTGAVRLSAGYYHTCALFPGRDDASFTCWGEGDKGQLGDGEPRLRGKANRLVRFYRGTALSLGNAFGCGLWGDDVVECWGTNALGQLADGSTTGRNAPTDTHFLGIAQVAAGGAHGCLLTKSGEVWCWGANRDGQVGDGSTLVHTMPELVRL